MKTRIARLALFALPCSLAYAAFALSAVAAEKKDGGDSKAKSPLVVAAVPAKPEAKKYDLKYKLKRGDVLRYDVSHRASIRSTIDTTTQEAQSKTDSVKAWKVTDVLPDGDIEFTNVVEQVHMVNQLPDKDPTEYDSTRNKTPPPGFEDAAKAVGVPLSMMKITPRGKVVSRNVAIRNQGADDDAPIVLRLPEDKIAIGDTWDEPFDVKVALEQNGTKMIQTRRHHRLKDVSNGVATIEVTYQVLSPIDAKIETQLVQRLMQGEVRFDLEKGQVLGQEMEIDKRIIGFAGPTSSMQYIMKMEEKLLAKDKKVAETTTPKRDKASKPSNDSRSTSTTTRSGTSTASRRGSSRTITR
jgi:hypothetical protein